MALPNTLRSIWQRLLLRGVHYSDRHGQLDLLYRMPDPWQLDCEKEHYRFDTTNAIIRREFGHPTRVIEIGCGEGVQSARLMEVCNTLHGIDISPTAVSRARRRCPSGTFEAGDISTGFKPALAEPADLVVACEVIYYVKDPTQFLDTLSSLGRCCLASYYTQHRARLDPVVARHSDAGNEVIRYAGTEWVVAWWRNGH